MTTPGSNLLSIAMRVIKPVVVQYFPHSGRQMNGARQYVDSYGPAIDVVASVQPVKRSKYQFNGLDFSKSYVSIHAERDMNTIVREVSGDYFVFNGRKYKLVDDTDWTVQDGWSKALAIDIGPAK